MPIVINNGFSQEDFHKLLMNRTAYETMASLLNSRQLKFCLSAVGIFGFLAFESSREALKDRSEDEVRHTD
jgi:hypothetical protein